MSDFMEQHVLTMPYELAMADELSRMQFWSRAQLAYKELVALRAATPAQPTEAREPDMRAICEALGFDPTNHHNAAKCPYCRPAQLTKVERWLPIETAPKDGTFVVIADAEQPSAGLLIARWRHDAWWSKPTPSGHSTVWADATHWQPLPAPPALSTEGGGNGLS